MDRDQIDTPVQNDYVIVQLDAFNDQRRSYQFRVNPLGVQADAYSSEVDGGTLFVTNLTQLLFSYKLNARTVLFVGYSDNQLGLENVGLTRTDRTLFFKIGYAWIL